LPRGVEAFMIK